MSIYGIIIGIAVIIGLELFRRKNSILKEIDILFILLFALIGARVLFLLHNIEEIKANTIGIYAIWDGGLALYGALIGIFFAIYILSLRKKYNFFKITDSLLLYLPLIQAIGRLGNYFNHELYGKPTNLPWGVYIPPQYRYLGYESYTLFHPVFIYESILNIFLFLLLIFINKRKKVTGYITSMYLIGYSLIRVFLNTLRIDKEYFMYIETSDLLSAIFLTIGISLLISQLGKDMKIKLARFISRPVILSLVAFSAISIPLTLNIPFAKLLPLILLTFVLPITAIILFKEFNLTSDFNLQKREERPKLFAVMFVCLLLSLLIALKLQSIELITIYTVMNLSFFLGLLITFYWKISFHMIWGILSTFVIIYLWNIPYLYLLILLLPFIGWSRVVLKRHTPKQVIGGTILTLICIFFVLTFIKF